MAWQFMGNELLQGKKVRLAYMTPEAAHEIGTWNADIGYQRSLRRGLVYPTPPDGIAKWLVERSSDFGDHDEIPFAIRRLEDDQLIGLLVTKDIMWSARHCAFWMGIGSAEHRGKGYGSDALRVFVRYAFMEMNLNCVRLEVMAYNPEGILAYQAAGFKKDGVLRQFVYRDGVYWDVIPMSILRSEWDALPAEKR
jgi:RimJ/RimL family protein N-acetyltransferase